MDAKASLMLTVTGTRAAKHVFHIQRDELEAQTVVTSNDI
jgi:hypothetical protein